MAKMMNRDRHAYICPAVVVIAADSGEDILTTASGNAGSLEEESFGDAGAKSNNFFSNEEDSAGKK